MLTSNCFYYVFIVLAVAILGVIEHTDSYSQSVQKDMAMTANAPLSHRLHVAELAFDNVCLKMAHNRSDSLVAKLTSEYFQTKRELESLRTESAQ